MPQNALSDLERLPHVHLPMMVQELLAQKLVVGSIEPVSDVTGAIVVDSRKVTANAVYIAISGGSHDGHSFISDAERRGAALVICEKKDPAATVPQLVVRSSREAWSWACSLAYSHPGNDLKLIGVTGTNGKTSTVWMIRGILSAVGVKSATIGTLGFYCGDEHVETAHTTPDPPVLYALLREAGNRGCHVVAMEVSSHAIAQKKLAPLKFCAAGMTSFSQDHLDFHGTMTAYLDTKLTLFRSMLLPKAEVFLHQSVASKCLDAIPNDARVTTYGHDTVSALQLSSEPAPMRGSTVVRLLDAVHGNHKSEYRIPFIGEIFVNNFAAAMIAARAFAEDLFAPKYCRSISDAVHAVPGRLEPVRSVKPWRPLVLVDYAHTPDALEKALIEARTVTQGRLICVFGCGGDRDKSKRPLMGRLSETHADFTIITNDNPRTETPGLIVQEIEGGFLNPDTKNLRLVEDRRLAIQTAVGMAGGSDTVLIAGKGHEAYQIFGHDKMHFSDVEESTQALDSSRHWCVVGAGVSGLAAALYLNSRGDHVTVSDGGLVGPATQEKLETAGIQLFQGGHELKHLETSTALALSPGVPQSNCLLVQALAHQMPIATEIDLGVELFPGTLISVTGTNGKSTTCAMIEHAFRALGRNAVACGNIGVPPTAIAAKDAGPESYWVCELSSYQLERTHRLPSKVAIFTSFSFDHLARHGSLKEYFDCKWNVTGGLGGSDLLILRGEVFSHALKMGVSMPPCRILIIHDEMPKIPTKSDDYEEWWLDGETIQNYSGLISGLEMFSLSGTHNAVNAAFCIATAQHLLHASSRQITDAIATFQGLPYRCQLVGKTRKGKPVINDSKSTNLESTLIALSAADKPVILLMGGAGKGEPYGDLAKSRSKITLLITFGASRADIAKDLPKDLPTISFAHMADAVSEAFERADMLDCGVLFSPGCASFDEFRNYEHRGDEFNRILKTR